MVRCEGQVVLRDEFGKQASCHSLGTVFPPRIQGRGGGLCQGASLQQAALPGGSTVPAGVGSKADTDRCSSEILLIFDSVRLEKVKSVSQPHIAIRQMRRCLPGVLPPLPGTDGSGSCAPKAPAPTPRPLGLGNTACDRATVPRQRRAGRRAGNRSALSAQG